MIRLALPLIALYSALLAALVLIFLMWAERSYRKRSAVFAQPRALKMMNPGLELRRPFLRMGLIVISVFLIGVALSRPQWGFFWAGEKDKGIDIIFAVDLSKSMLARDVPPDRVTSAKDEIARFTGRSEGDRFALIGFAGDAFLFCPLTMNRDAFLRALDNLNVGSVRRGGTSYFNLITAASRSYRSAGAKDRALIIVSDGEDTEGKFEEAVELAKKERISVYSIGIGTVSGGLIALTDKDGKSIVVKDDKGQPVRTRLEESSLKKIAADTGGMYERYSEGSDSLEKIRAGLAARTKADAAEETFGRTYKERFQIPLFIAFVLLVSELFLSSVNSGGKR